VDEDTSGTGSLVELAIANDFSTPALDDSKADARVPSNHSAVSGQSEQRSGQGPVSTCSNVHTCIGSPSRATLSAMLRK